MRLRAKITSYEKIKTYLKEGWAKRKVEKLKAENKLNKKPSSRLHWNTKIEIIKRGNKFHVSWVSNTKTYYYG